MNIVIATDGALDAATASEMVAPLAAGGTVTVLTVVEVPPLIPASVAMAATFSFRISVANGKVSVLYVSLVE